MEAWGFLDSRRDTMHDLWVEFFRIVPLLLCAVLPVIVGSSSQSDWNGRHRKRTTLHVLVLGCVETLLVPLVIELVADLHAVNDAIWMVVLDFHGFDVRRMLQSS